MPKSTVAVIKEKEDTYQAVQQAIQLVNGVKWKPGDKVVVKPNICIPARGENKPSSLTRLAVTMAVLQLVKESGAKPILAESGIQSVRKGGMQAYFEAYGILEPAKKLGVPVIDLTKDQQIEVSVPNYRSMPAFHIGKTIIEADFLISVPALKHHFQTIISFGIKNLKGCITDADKRLCHQNGLEGAIADLLSVCPPGLVVIDAWKTWDRIIDKYYDLDLIIAGTDPVATDHIGARIMGFEPGKITMLKYAATSGLGENNIDNIEVKGEDISQYKLSLTRPPGEYVAYGENKLYVMEEKACSGCWSQLRSIAGEIFSQYKQELPELRVLMGEIDHLPDEAKKTIAIGNCCKKLAKKVPLALGCPPKREKILETAQQLIKQEKNKH